MSRRGQEYQAEVGLLSRNILVTGETAMDRHKLGAHIRVEGSGRISGTQIVRGGQYNVMGAYPFHFHMIGDGSGMYFADNSVYKCVCSVVVLESKGLLSKGCNSLRGEGEVLKGHPSWQH